MADRVIAEARQLALPFDEPESFAAADFIEAQSNAQARTALAAPESWVNRRLVLWGEAGCGKTNLGRLWVEARGAIVLEAARLREPVSPEGRDLLIEDIDIMAAPLAVLATLDRALAAQQSVLLTSRVPPARLAVEPADLASRLRASLTIQIEPAEESLLEALLLRLAAARQMTLTAPLRQFLLTRLPRRPSVLHEAVARLDRAALALGTAPSRRMAERLLAELADPPNHAGGSTERHETDMASLL
ncbi:DNA replication protein [Acidiphilium sp. AL]|uniref:DnaA/Hda family protein n=1 Tax=Acidiphilium iwatense TaxID=768198 RepID=A0ABS9DUC7_9PROT|nr:MULTISPECIES: DnaA/Hda family protein [Acidiphilium]MCF3945326.1 DnaA/Hda family protein [Acidiphilium iwatense]MCU4159380.1 DNA replication protein [Acidiphilium sp. AL]